MHFERTSHVHVSARDLSRYLAEPQHALSGWAAMTADIADAEQSDDRTRRYQLSSRTTPQKWFVDVVTVVPDRKLVIEYGRLGNPPQGRIEYDLEPQQEGTTLRSIGEIRVGRLLRAVNTLLGRRLNNADEDLGARVQRWLNANPDDPSEGRDDAAG
jgi:hypothetical protein